MAEITTVAVVGAGTMGSQIALQTACVLGRVRATTDLAGAVGDADLVIDAIFEDLTARREARSRLSAEATPDAVLASNSSTIAVSRLVDVVSRPERCCNMHFSHPVTVMQLCEVVRGPRTSEETVRAAMDFVRSIGRVPVLVSKEIHGFIVNRILFAAAAEAFRLLEGGPGAPPALAETVRRGELGHKTGRGFYDYQAR